MSQTAIIALILIAPLFANAQFGAYDHVKISEKHLEKLNKVTSPAKKLKKYHKYYSKDSVRLIRDLDRYWKQKSDSLTNSVTARKQHLESKRSELSTKVKSITVSEERYKMPPEFERHFSSTNLHGIYASMQEFISESSKESVGSLLEVNQILARSVPQVQSPINAQISRRGLFGKLSLFKRPNPSDNPAVKYALAMKTKTTEYQDQVRKYQAYGSMSADSLKNIGSARLENEVFQQLQSKANFGDYQKDKAQLNQLQQMRDQVKDQMENVTDSTRRLETAKKKAAEAAMKYIENNPASLKATQRKMSLLMNKYSFVGNSNDLRSAIKKTSLAGKSFREHLVIAANFQVLGLDPVSFDFSPQLGYKFNTKLAVGIGGTYRKTFNDSIPTLSPTILGYKTFVSFNAYRSFFLYGEYDRNSPGAVRLENTYKRIWRPAAFLGVGRTFSVHKKIDMTVAALYNFLYEHGDPIYPRPFVVRFGFQLSELALLKRKPGLTP
ncbi:MAG: hypothetical protein WDO14_02485 [Bacteroidota bacterium]